MAGSWHSYSKIYNLGHGALENLFVGKILVEEKLDGSQFSMGVHDGQLRCRSKGQQLVIDYPEKMFVKAVETAEKLAPLMKEGYTYRCEYFQKPKHNSLAYDRIPKDHLIVFDVEIAECAFLSPEDKIAEVERLGLEYVPQMFYGDASEIKLETIHNMLETTSCLGGQLIEGVVIKNYSRFTRDGKVMMGKHVSERFKELNHKDFKERNPSKNDVVGYLKELYRTEARWDKAVIHLKERGELTNSPKDIGLIIKEVQSDILNEEAEEIKAKLYNWAKGHITRAAVRGLPEWYKEKLLESQFEGKNED